jgi:hypothetical protein
MKHATSILSEWQGWDCYLSIVRSLRPSAWLSVASLPFEMKLKTQKIKETIPSRACGFGLALKRPSRTHIILML